MTNQPHREFLYRMAFPLGRHIIGYEVEKIQAAVDWFATQPSQVPIVVWGYGEGGMLALDAAALDSRIATAVVSGYFGPRDALWQEPIFRNVWSFKRDFGDAELAAMIAPRKLIVETREGPSWDGPSQANPQRKGAAPGKLAPAPPELVRSEVDRARSLGANIEATPQALPLRTPPEPAPKLAPPPDRTHRQFDELVAYTQRLLHESQAERDRYWANTDMKSSDEWRRTRLRIASASERHDRPFARRFRADECASGTEILRREMGRLRRHARRVSGRFRVRCAAGSEGPETASGGPWWLFSTA
jgi:hypothetical protein